MKIRALVLALLLILVLSWGGIALVAGEKSKACDLSFKVLRASNGKPVRNAAVVLHPVDKKGKQESGGIELKTDSDGNAAFNSVPYGKLRIQVLAPGFQTFGQDYDINEPSKIIEVKLNPPQKEYSIYENKPKNDDPKTLPKESPKQ
ncbi:MAG TPA: carboxypeptidase-like regulatory domain-containing protein [Terriglobales bacterium]|nr:carboxypeptidase-like regulatory domain-containing protein [Terriglobales bacterium]